MQVLQQTTQHIEDVEILQLSNEAPASQDSPITVDLAPSSRPDALLNDHLNGLRLTHPEESTSLPKLSSPFLTALVPSKFARKLARSKRLKALLAAAFLVAVPVFVQAPLVRVLPEVSLALTALWLLYGWKLLKTPNTQLWGDLVIGFSWTWLAGAIYWGWFRWDPYVHLPIESIGLPIVLVLLSKGKAKIGNYFYLGSLLGTAITDLYFYCVGLIPYWRQLMISPPAEAGQILHSALLRMETYQGVGCAIVLLTLLIMLGTIPLRSLDAKWWAFGGAVLSTILVDSLFFVAAVLS